MKRKPLSKRKDKERLVAEEIASVLFDNGQYGEVARLMPQSLSGESVPCGAWDRVAVIALILRKLRGAK